MENVYRSQLAVIGNLASAEAKLNCLTSTLRSILQLVVVTSIELASKKTSTEELDIDSSIERFCIPSDGLPREMLDKIIPHLRSYQDSRIAYGWFEEIQNVKPCLSKDIVEWVEFRNRAAHGVLDAQTTKEWVDKIQLIIEKCFKVFSSLIPTIDSAGKVLIRSKSESIYISTPVLRNGLPIVLAKVKQRKGLWSLEGQALIFDRQAGKFTVELNEDTVFSGLNSGTKEEYEIKIIDCDNQELIVSHNVPIRQTATFEGRKKELQALQEWYEDEDSRRCLIYGDGGYGKTTLVLEFINKYLDGDIQPTWFTPSVISFYTAKMTRWTADGLTHFTSTKPVMDECLRGVMQCFYPVLDKKWYSISGRTLIDRVVQELRARKIERNDVLLIIDNSESLAANSQDTADLASFFRDVGKSVGRIIITSRRNESIEAAQILIDGLDEVDCVSLLKCLAETHGADAIIKAGSSTLRKVSNKLMRKPILLEALVVYVARSGVSIDRAMDNLYKKSDTDLLEFLYEDAWERLDELQRKVFYVIVSIASPLNDISIGRACQILEIQHSEFQSSLQETHFASVSDYGKGYEIELVDLAKRFFEKKLSEVENDSRNSVLESASLVDEYAKERDRVEREYQEDRVSDAFRNEYAKAAKVEGDKENYPEADELFSLAVEDDPCNSALNDRYAWLLLNKIKNPERALTYAEKAIALDPNNCDAAVTLALVYYRLNNIQKGDEFIDVAHKLGRPKSFCLLRKAIARFHMSYSCNGEVFIAVLQSADTLLKQALSEHVSLTGYDAKNLRDIHKYQELVLKRLSSKRLTEKRFG
ncbi:hypothetical protein L2719_10285 [Shewanella schlegeliana]|uniref:Uncharacterized protein n=1 Tax=Shewanella schlegeliana TaxID=190308 RepID=A0ABS1T1R2_9GAMM|nr:hypothetical protein [Shewanella schlegeliana]MBL4914733.1 hypothetical protein [Shewanella schlegeliana]MCL1109935.1 hypothetical protein [Shewanella schlegeliana]GIU25578.1 hypothetical protein TUM4433_10510 [Shewanella schlegeliana]